MKLKNQRGFTLVELLVVVAIIGILATVGIPSFVRMVANSKKGEAKVLLNALYTAEAGFFAEYGGYGNNLTKIGFVVDGADGTGMSARATYSVGFPTGGNCGTGVPTLEPAANTGPGGVIAIGMPSYFPAPAGNGPGLGVAVPPAAGSDKFVYARSFGGTRQAACLAGVVAVGGPTYTATATGGVRGGTAAADLLATLDQWNINQLRVMSNVVDGNQ